MSTAEVLAMVSTQLEDIHLGLARLLTTMDCLADSRTLALSDFAASADVFPTLALVGRTYLDQMETLMQAVDNALPQS